MSISNKTRNEGFWKSPLSFLHGTGHFGLPLIISSLIHLLIRKLKVLTHKLSISRKMFALDWLSLPNLHNYQLWPSLSAEEYKKTHRCSVWLQVTVWVLWHLLICVSSCFLSNKGSLFNHLRKQRTCNGDQRPDGQMLDVVIIWLQFSFCGQIHSIFNLILIVFLDLQKTPLPPSVIPCTPQSHSFFFSDILIVRDTKESDGRFSLFILNIKIRLNWLMLGSKCHQSNYTVKVSRLTSKFIVQQWTVCL